LAGSIDGESRPTLVADKSTASTARPSLVTMDIQEKIPALRSATFQ
jgi:hypothetical protein